MTEILFRALGVETRQIGDDIFLASRGPGSIHHLNAMGAAIWRVLEEPLDRGELVDLFAEVFADQSREALAADIDGFVAQLKEKGVLDTGERAFRLSCNDLETAIEFVDCDDALETLRSVARGWRLEPSDASSAEARIRMRRVGVKYGIDSPSRPEPIYYRHPVSAACSLIVDIVNFMVDDNPALLCLHSGAVKFGDRLVVFPSSYNAGKSTLIARLACEGVTVFSDDVIPIASGPNGARALAPGVAPRPRLPLPESASARFRAYVEERGGAEDFDGGEGFRYLNLPEGQLTPYGEPAEIGAFVFLSRTDRDVTRLTQVDPGKALQRLIWRNFGRAAPAGDILDRFAGLVTRSGCFRLEYSDLDAAAEMLCAAFEDWRPEDFAHEPADDEFGTVGRRLRADAAPKLRLEDRVRRAPAVEMRRVGAELFLADEIDGAIFAVAGVGAAIWELIEEPASVEEVAVLLTEAFPEVELDAVRADVRAFLDDLLGRNFVALAEPSVAA